MSKLNKMREQIANEFIAALQKDEIPWHQDWHNIGTPHNAVTGRGYHGLNFFWLSCVAMQKNYSDPRWCTFNQAKAKGWKVNKGEKGTRVEFWALFDTEKKKKLTTAEVEKLRRTLTDEEFAERVKPVSNVFTVFNGDQIDGIPELPKAERTEFSSEELITARDKLLDNMCLELREGGNRAYYSPSEDYVRMPTVEQFDNTYSYMSVFLHEAAHASGAAHRLNRDLTGSFGSESYAKEELRAEIASAFTASATGINYEQAPQMENHTAYVQNWISVLQNNPNELFRAIKDATKISDYLIEKGEFAVGEELTEAETSESEVTVIDPDKFNDMLQGAKPRYRYWEITKDEYTKLFQAGFQNTDDYRQSFSHTDKIIFRFEEAKTAEVNAILLPNASKMIKA